MEDKLTIETPEQIPLEFPLAGIGSRFLAVTLDHLIQAALMVVLVAIGLLIFSGIRPKSEDFALWAIAIYVLLAFLLQSAYFAYFEAVWNGQTPGKRRVHIRVVKDSGRPITPYEAITRNLMRFVDGMGGYGIGILSVLISSRNKRLGDYVAGTVVVHEKPLADHASLSWNSAQTAIPSAYDVTAMSPEEFQLIEAFLLRRHQLATEVRLRLAHQIANRLGDKLQLTLEERAQAEPLLERLANQYRSRAQYR